MATKLTKRQADKRCGEIVQKMMLLFKAEYATIRDYEAMYKVVDRMRRRMKL